MTGISKMSRVQSVILRYINKNFVKGSVRTELVGADEVLVKDWKGESMVLTVSIYGHIIDADTKTIYAYDVMPYNHNRGQRAESKLFKK